jgi:hypothetical protein
LVPSFHQAGVPTGSRLGGNKTGDNTGWLSNLPDSIRHLIQATIDLLAEPLHLFAHGRFPLCLFGWTR